MKRLALSLALVVLACASPSPERAPASGLPAGDARASQVAARAWEHESSDLPVDERIRFGSLPNGMRYAWMNNPEPKERAYLRLHVDVGSLAEEESERGMAHFLEHMAFNGSANFAPDTLVEWFQEHGMEFGADLNAFTSYSQTVYKLDLAHADAEALADGFLVMRDWAADLTLSPEEVEKEKGVVDGEEAESDSAGRRVYEAVLAEQYAGTRYPARLPIGLREARHGFTADSVRAFYERWYRPENLTLVVVGDLGELDPTALIEERFGDLPVPAAPHRSEPELGEPELAERFFAIHEPELPSVDLSVERLVAWEDEPDTRATRLENLDLLCARRMLNLRFRELAKAQDAPFLSAGVSGAGGLDVYDGEVLNVSCESARWREALTAAVDELRRALLFGFQEAELEEVRADWLRSLDEAVERERTRSSSSYASELVRAAEDRVVPTRAAAERALARPVIEALDLEACHAAFAEAWSEGVLHVSSVGALALEDGDELRAAWEEANRREVQRGEDIEVRAFAYASPTDGAAGELVSEWHVEDLDLWLLEFANGVRLNLKATDFKEQQLLFSARLAEGYLTLDPADYAVGWVASQVVDLAGLGAHTVDELRRLTAGKRVGVGFSCAEDTLVLGGATTAEDLELQLELLCAHLTDPGWRDDGIRMLADRVPLIFERLRHVASGPLVLEFLPAVFHGDRRFAQLPPRVEIEAVDMEDVRHWLAPELREGPLELTIVGDCDVEQVRRLAARTIGLLPPRRALDPHEARRTVEPPEGGLRMVREVPTEDDKSFAMILFPIGDGLETERRRTLSFLGQVVQDRLRIEVRERLGAAYSPAAGANPSRTFPGVGLLTMQSNVDPEKAETLVEACLAVARSLLEEGVTQDEVERLAEPVLAQLRDARRQNEFWIAGVAQAQTRPASLDDLRALEAFYQGLEAEAVSAAARRWLDPERASVLIVHPRRTGEGE